MSSDNDDGATLADRLATTLGAPSGQRILHARGTWATGVFTPSRAAAELSTAPVLSTPGTPATARFSSTLGGPRAHDADPSDQGLAVRVGALDLIMFTLPVFFVRNGPDLVEFLQATGSGDPGTLAGFLERHPEAATALRFAGQSPPAASFTGLTYHAVHAFGLVDARGVTRWARLSWQPEEPLPALTPERARTLPHDYLTAALADRLPARFRLTAHLPAPSDEIHDPTRLWTGDRTGSPPRETSCPRTAAGSTRRHATAGPVTRHDSLNTKSAHEAARLGREADFAQDEETPAIADVRAGTTVKSVVVH